jgi:hypothetical protein
MAYDESQAQRMRDALGEAPAVTEKRMMGALCFFLNGNMIGGTDSWSGGEPRFMFRVGKGIDEAMLPPHGELMIQGNRVMSGFYFVNAIRCDDDLLARWLDVALRHAGRLPPK